VRRCLLVGAEEGCGECEGVGDAAEKIEDIGIDKGGVAEAEVVEENGGEDVDEGEEDHPARLGVEVARGRDA